MTKSQKFYADIILSAIQSEDHFDTQAPLESSVPDAELLYYAWDRYFSEVGKWRELQTTRLEACKDWFQGLALNVPYMNYDILERAKDAGLLPEDATERKEDAFLDGYWTHLASQFIRLAEPRE